MQRRWRSVVIVAFVTGAAVGSACGGGSSQGAGCDRSDDVGEAPRSTFTVGDDPMVELAARRADVRAEQERLNEAARCAG